MMQFINENAQKYLISMIKSNSDALEELRVKSENENVPIIHRDVENMLKLLVKMNHSKSILEIGTAVGYSSLMFAEIGADITVTTLERYEKMYEKAIFNIELFKKSNQINAIFGNAGDLLKSMEKTFDLVFIDAAKSHYREFFELSLKNLNKGGVIISDNVLFKGRTVSDEYVERRNKTITRNMRNYLDFINEPPFFSVILPIGDGLSITIIEEDANEKNQ